MADDYIGKKMEDYRRGTLSAAYRQRLTPSGAKRGVWCVKFPPLIAFVAGGADGIGRAMVKGLCDAGCRVAFTGADSRIGQATAQATGSQFHQADGNESVVTAMRRVAASWGVPDVLVDCVGGEWFELTVCELLALRLNQLDGPRTGRIISIGGEDAPVRDLLIPSDVTFNRIVPGSLDSEYYDKMASLAVYLCSPAADIINGVTFRL